MISRSDLKSIFFITCTTLVIIFFSSFLFFFLEFGKNDAVNNLFDSVWWVVVTLTSLGYGDIYPVTVGGRLVGMFLMFCGLLLIGLVAGSVSKHYFEERDARKEGENFNLRRQKGFKSLIAFLSARKRHIFIALILLLLTSPFFYLLFSKYRSLKEGFMEDKEGNIYPVVQIGDKIWATKNLKSKNHSKGKSWCYERDEKNCETYGRLYDWEAAMVACPGDWFLPSDEDWVELEKYILDNNSNLLTVFGGHYIDGHFYDLNAEGFWWTSSSKVEGSAWSRASHVESDELKRNLFSTGHAFSVLCVKKQNDD